MNCEEIVCPPKNDVVTSFLTDVNQLILIKCIRAHTHTLTHTHTHTHTQSNTHTQTHTHIHTQTHTHTNTHTNTHTYTQTVNSVPTATLKPGKLEYC